MLSHLLLLLVLQDPAAATDPGAPAQPAPATANEGPVVTHVANDGGGGFFFPPQASTLAEGLDEHYMFTHWVSVFFTVLIFGVMFWFVIRFHRSRHPKAEVTATHNTALELVWSVPPAFILGVIFWNGITDYLDLRTPPRDALEIQVTGQQWAWSFTYPNGATDNVLYVPVDRPVVLTMTSIDVLHSMYIPAFRVKMDVVPGRYNKLWFQANRTGQFAAFCAEYCGTQHSAMLAPVVVQQAEEWNATMEKVAVYWEGIPPAEAGAITYKKRGCNACHSTDGSVITGPSFKGLFGKTESLRDGSTVVVDENYIRESILIPSRRVVSGFNDQMPPFQGRIKDPEIEGLIAYIKSLKD